MSIDIVSFTFPTIPERSQCWICLGRIRSNAIFLPLQFQAALNEALCNWTPVTSVEMDFVTNFFHLTKLYLLYRSKLYPMKYRSNNQVI